MKVTAIQHWDSVYERGDNWSDLEPSEYVVDIAPQLKSGDTILDIGCGTGRNALYLARLGFNVEAFDVSAAAIKSLQKTSSQHKLKNLVSYQADYCYWQRRDRFDLVLLHGVLNSIPSELLPELLQYTRKRINYGGRIFISVFHPLPGEAAIQGVNLHHDVESKFIQEKAFYGYETVRHDIRIFSHSHGDLTSHSHCIERFLFQKPNLIPVNA